MAQLVYGSQDDHLVLRLKCAKFIYHHREDFEPFLDVPFDEYVFLYFFLFIYLFYFIFHFSFFISFLLYFLFILFWYQLSY